ncbi:hypothetical protein E4U58_007226 [Claviceps cyperi]|nr:hypothetical protein E4U58_007226 [Claviceps cyperi]
MQNRKRGFLTPYSVDVAPPGLGTGESGLGSRDWGAQSWGWGSAQSAANEDPGKVPQQRRDGAVGGTDQCERFAKFCMLRTLADVAIMLLMLADGDRRGVRLGNVSGKKKSRRFYGRSSFEPSLQRVGHHGRR